MVLLGGFRCSALDGEGQGAWRTLPRPFPLVTSFQLGSATPGNPKSPALGVLQRAQEESPVSCVFLACA